MSVETHPLSIHGLLYNKINLFRSTVSTEISVRYIDTVIEEAMQIVYEICVDNADINHRVIEDLRPLIVDAKSLTVLKQDSDYTIYQLPVGYFRNKRLYGKITKPGCPQRNLRLWKAKANMINNLLRDKNWNPSYQWGVTFYDAVDNGVKVFHNGQFNIDDIKMDFYKKFTPLRCPAAEDENFYTWYEGTKIATNQETEFLGNYLPRRITDVASAIIQRDRGDSNNFSMRLQAIMSFENLYK